MAIQRQLQRVNMVRHHHESIEQVTRTLKWLQGVSHNRRPQFRLTEETRAMPLIEPRFAGFLESALILMPGPRVPRFWMKFQPRFQFFFPFRSNFAGTASASLKVTK